MRRACLPGNRCLGRYPLGLIVVGALVLGELIGLLVVNRLDPSPSTRSGSSPPSSPQQRRAGSAAHEDDEVTPAGGARGVHILDLLARRTPFKFDEDATELDASRKYKVARSFLSPDAEFGSPDAGEVCLATQGSLDRLHTLVELAQLWNGPLSLAVFVPNAAQFQALRAYLALLRSCSEPVRANVRVDLVFPVGVNVTRAVPWSTRGSGGGPEFSCAGHASLLRALQASEGARVVRGSVKQMLYPQNHLRNVARDGCSPQKHFFVVDIDVMPKPGLWDELSDFLASANSGRRPPCAKCVFVVPTYEAREMVPVPRTKRELLAMVRRREARPFHEKSFVFNQYATNHAAWEALPHTEDGLHAAYRVQHYEFFYEPFYVAGKEVPRYDERFVGYGFTRNTQVYETHAAGFEFWVLDEAFALHRGMQNHRARGYWRERQNALNQRKLASFKRDVKRKYQVTATKTTLPPATKPLLL
ncbi:beta-1,4-glucuronyltransferase 1-like [Dermacentor andersoni]|uniref:beta-1,4-glucuronyltransferase 1-like n=1 Tax=Dermacentor andersoni TaxID=34620 RepID=UPI002155F22C|nr:beta-1,4-glucuronyltransferase 1-like [Dermacentor andersoni]